MEGDFHLNPDRFLSRQLGIASYYNNSNSKLGGNLVRSIVVRKSDASLPESVWLGTEDGDVSRFLQDSWTVYTTKDGLPSNKVISLAIDKYNRVWAATDKEVAYWDRQIWNKYNNISSLSIAFGPACQECAIDDDDVWIGTENSGLTNL